MNDNQFTEQEQWVWDQLVAGKIADLNEKEGYCPLPREEEGWTETRVLRYEFLRTILLDENRRKKLAHKKVWIKGTWFKEIIDLSDSSFENLLGLEYCRFDKKVNFSRFKTPGPLSLDGSKLEGELNMERIQVESSLYMGNNAEFSSMNLLGAKIGGQINMTQAKVNGGLGMDSLRVDGSLLMHKKAEFENIDLRSAKICGQLCMHQAKVNGDLIMDKIQVDGPLLMRNGAEFADVNLNSAKIGGQLSMNHSKVNGILYMESLSVGSHLFMRNIDFIKPQQQTVVILLSTVRGGLNFTGSKNLPLIDLSGSFIGNELCLAQERERASWRSGAKLTLRNASVGAIQDHPDAWPDELELQGFEYKQLGGFSADVDTDMGNREVSWYLEWLNRQKEYSPQPYEQLAKVLENQGHKDKADDIRYARKEKERHLSSGLKRLWMTCLDSLIGYGYQMRNVLHWFVFLLLAGTLAIQVSGEPWNPDYKFLDWGFGYSLDMLLPVVHLREYHYRHVDLTSWAHYYFYFHQVMGYVLASFLIAGLSGLTKK